MTKPMIREHNLETDAVIEREMTDEEIQQRAELDAFDAEKAIKEQQKQTARQAVLDKLGLTAEEIASLLA